MRIRTIKPEFWLHEGLCSCPDFTRLLAIALLNWADDHGYFMAHPSLLRGSLFPFLEDSKMIPGSLQDLSRVGWIELGTDNQGRPIGRIVNFSKHQRVDKPKDSLIKDLCTFRDASTTHPRFVQDVSQEEGKGTGNREQGKEVPPTPKGDGEGDLFSGDVAPPAPASLSAPKKKPSPLPTSPEAKAIADIVHRRHDTAWSDVEIRYFKRLHPINLDDLATLAAYYGAHWPPHRDKNVLRHDLKTLLNNWQGEVDRASVWKIQNTASKADRYNGLNPQRGKV